MQAMNQASYEFHVARRARDRYQFDEALFTLTGNVILANFHAARLFAQKMNQQRDLLNYPEQAVRAGDLNAMGLIDEIQHLIVQTYRQQVNPQVMTQALDWLTERLGAAAVDSALRRFVAEFPTVAVYRRALDPAAYLEGTTGGVPNRQVALEELLLLWLANANPAFNPFLELFDDTTLEKDTVYLQILPALHAFFAGQPAYGPEQINLIDMLRAPALASPHSLNGQLEYFRQRLYTIIGKHLFRLLSSLDFLQEEQKAVFLGPGPALVYEFQSLEAEPEHFSPDRDWMPALVLLAKNAFVWLDQLTKKYQRPIQHLDQIPDEELEQLERWGFTGLWLIGLWERSAASRQIKQWRGNPDAVASAYSLLDYQIAGALGGESAYTNLRGRAWRHGIRLASDMVPNHMGIDSRWVIEHPDWFIQLDYSPFPVYSFTGANLSSDERVGLYIEDHYFDNSDAAVVFKRVDHGAGETRYIYHGNDGTLMPWNDTAQLNYLLPEVREAVIQTILQVARMFPVIRFDAAMTLAKKHYQRLWFPEPGSGGAIPTRAEHGLTKEQFDAAFPEEFWRMVVDRVAQEAPDTLLLAEAFWLMEGYFVRTLGMHRVYNSAFMNMLRDEKNQEYRLVIRNTIEFDPEILKRYVNFMSNPDERTAVDQFGKGDKYFGISTLLATMPGLPMFGHGQVEGYTEKYGMEFQRAYWDEKPDPYLVERHSREIFPLLRQRYLFAEVRDFLLYDFFTPGGNVNEDVYAYSNRSGDERALVIYHNKYAETRGWIRTSVAYSAKSEAGEERRLLQKSLAEGLGLNTGEGGFILFRDQVGGLEYIRSCQEIHTQGWYAELGAYKVHVFIDFRAVQDNEWQSYAQLAEYLNGRGVPSIQEALREVFLQPVHYPFRELVNAGMLRWLLDNWETGISVDRSPDLPVSQSTDLPPHQPPDRLLILVEVEQKYLHLLREIDLLTQAGREETALAGLAGELHARMGALLSSPDLPEGFGKLEAPDAPENARAVAEWERLALLVWACTHALGQVLGPIGAAERSRSWLDEWLLGKLATGALQDLGLAEAAAWRALNLVKILISQQDWAAARLDTVVGRVGRVAVVQKQSRAFQMLQTWLGDADVQAFIGVNRYQGLLWFNKESMEELLRALLAVAVVGVQAQAATDPEQATLQLQALVDCAQQLRQALEKSGYQVEKLLEAAKE